MKQSSSRPGSFRHSSGECISPHTFRHFLLFLLLLVTGMAGKTQNLLYVNHAATGANNGTSWANAFTELQSAIDVAQPADQIWVAKGVYKPTVKNGGTTDPDKTFYINRGMGLYGGFNGTETSLTQRNFIGNVTILSGDLDNNDLNADGDFLADSTGDIQGSNAYHVVRIKDAGVGLRLDGFHITAGKGDQFDDGGGIYNHASEAGIISSPAIENCSFLGNHAYSGGALANHSVVGAEASPVVTNCSFSGNASTFGGGAFENRSTYDSKSNPVFQGCTFIGNRSDFIGGAWHNRSDNGGIANPRAIDCSFESNRTIGVGGGGAILNESIEAEGSPFFSNCSFINNMAFTGGGLTNSGVNNGQSKPVFEDCLFTANKAQFYGGGVYNLGSAGCTASPVFTNCIFRENSAFEGGALYSQCADNGTASPSAVNCVFANNTVVNINQYQSAIMHPVYTNCVFFRNANQGGSEMINDGSWCLPTVTNCIFWGGSGSWKSIENKSGVPQLSYTLLKETACPPGAVCGNGMIFNQNPLFVDAANGNLRLQPGSPAIDAGDNSALPPDITADLDGNARLFNATGLPLPRVDLGAYEFGAPVSVFSPVQEDRAITVFPNPAASIVNLRFYSTAAGPSTLRLFSISGNLLLQTEVTAVQGQNVLPLPIGFLSPGLYKVQITRLGNSGITGIFMKSNH